MKVGRIHMLTEVIMRRKHTVMWKYSCLPVVAVKEMIGVVVYEMVIERSDKENGKLMRPCIHTRTIMHMHPYQSLWHT